MRLDEQQRKLVVVCVATVFVLILLSLLEPGYKDICTQAQHAAHEDCPRYDLVYVGLWHLAKGLDAASATITAIATALLTWVTIRVAALEKESGSTTRAELRAYISATAKRLTVREDNTTLIFHVHIKNVGQTPAFGVRVFAETSIGPFPLPSQIPLREENEEMAPNFVLFPGAETLTAPRKTLSPEEWAVLNDADFALYVFGKISFQDAFGRPQWTEFCSLLRTPQLQSDVDRAINGPDRRVDAGYQFARFNNGASFP